MKITFLGTGAAEGIPSFGCDCERCRVARKGGGKNVRQRSALLIEVGGLRILVDTPPEISIQLNKSEIFDLSAILLSHEHFDHIGGLTEFEYWHHPLHLFAGFDVLPKLRMTPRMEKSALLSCFHPHVLLHFGVLQVLPFKVPHHVPCYGFAFMEGGKLALHFSDSGTDLSGLHIQLLRQADVAIFHTPTFEEEGHHMSVEDVIQLVQKWGLKRAVITHINHHNYLHEELVERLSPYNITVSYDGMELEI